MFHFRHPIWQMALRALAVYAAVFVGFRLLGKRELGQMTVFDLVPILLISNAVQTRPCREGWWPRRSCW